MERLDRNDPRVVRVFKEYEELVKQRDKLDPVKNKHKYKQLSLKIVRKNKERIATGWY